MKTKIYALRDETRFLRYVGKTSGELQARLRAHLYHARKGGKTHKSNWIRSMLAKGLTPFITLIMEVDGNGNGAEIAYIKFFKEKGIPLVNGTAGGNGWPKGKPCPKSTNWSSPLGKKMLWFYKRNPDLVTLYGLKIKDFV